MAGEQARTASESQAQGTANATARIRKLGRAAEPYVIAQRRYFHQHPELSLQEVGTTEAIARELDAMRIPYERPLDTGLVATLAGTAPDAYREDGSPRRRLLIRADIDALAVTERTGVPFASERAGVMHACGHDCHIAMQLGALRVLAQMTDALHGEVRAVFQPSEENGQGARMMIDAGVLDGVDGAYAAHIWSEVDAGTISCEAGPRMANTDWFRVDVRGTSCHGAMPQRGADAIVAAAEIVNNLQTIVSRDLSPYEPAVVTVGELHGGTARNVIAGTPTSPGPCATYSERRTRRCRCSSRASRSIPLRRWERKRSLPTTPSRMAAVVNDEAASARCRRAIERVLGPEAVGCYRGTLSGEDFSEVLRRVPGVLAFVGTRNPALGATFAQHSCFYRVDESVLVKGAMLAAQYAVDFLAE